MPAKSTERPLPRYMTWTGRAFKYQRRVPIAVADQIGRKIWDFSLGVDLTRAMRRCDELTKEHDQIIVLVSDPVRREEMAQDKVALVPAMAVQEMIESDHHELTGTWEDVDAYIDGAQAYAPRLEREILASYIKQAFGDASYLEAIENPSPMLTVAENLPEAPTPPARDRYNKALFEAARIKLEDRLAELDVARPIDEQSRITARLEQYILKRAVRDATARNYRTRINRFVEYAGDLPMDQITSELIDEYLETLLNEMARTSVAQYFNPIRSLCRWAKKRKFVSEDVSADIEPPRVERGHVQKTRWQAFDRDEMTIVWKAVLGAWGPDGVSGLATERRAAFLMAFRVLLWTGMRPNEVFKLTKKDVKADRIEIVKTKTGVPRDIPLAEPIADFYQFMQQDGFASVQDLKSPSNKMSDLFTKKIRDAGLDNDRHVLYSLKDTLLLALEGLGASENVQRTVIGHFSGRGHFGNYKEPAKIEEMRSYLDRVTYCEGL